MRFGSEGYENTFRDTNIESVSQLAVRLSARIISSLSLKNNMALVVLQSASSDNLITSAYCTVS